jgi:hypothetical protein
MSDMAMHPSPNCETAGPFFPSLTVFMIADASQGLGK